uniref:Uncharacterized protein n=1 Tax=Sarcoptes scabiei TaxID=52283 RepID=A0A834VEI1_SARSC
MASIAVRGLGVGPWEKLMERFKEQKRASFRIPEMIHIKRESQQLMANVYDDNDDGSCGDGDGDDDNGSKMMLSLLLCYTIIVTKHNHDELESN